MLFYIIIIIIKYNYLLPVGRAMNMNLLQSFGVDRSLKCKFYFNFSATGFWAEVPGSNPASPTMILMRCRITV